MDTRSEQFFTLLSATLSDLKDSITTLSAKIDNVSERVSFVEGSDMKSEFEKINNRLKHMEEQITRIDKSQAVIYAVAGFFGAIASILVTFAKSVFVPN